MKIPYYRVNAFISSKLLGNPAGVCLLENWISDNIMQFIAKENDLSETAFLVKEDDNYRIRWFTPKTEVDLCGHATLASAFIIFNYTDFNRPEINFLSLSGILSVKKDNDYLTLNFPSDTIEKINTPDYILRAFNSSPVEAYKGNTDILLVFANENEIRECKPDLKSLEKAEGRGIIITAKGDKIDFVSRFFAPQSGINEDPVTGSAHTTLVPYWSKRLGKNSFIAHQLSLRGGELLCNNLNDRIEITGKAGLFMSGYIYV
jgi:PhzF family phenazine biosynthesis protein